MRRIVQACASLIILAACGGAGTVTQGSPSTLGGGNWPMYRGDLARDGHPSGASLTPESAKRLRPAWEAQLNGAVNGTPVVAGGMVVAASAGGMVAAFRADTGARVWMVDGLGPISGSPHIAGNRVIVGSLNGHVYALDLTGGGRQWDALAPGVKPAIWSSPTVFGQLVLVGVSSQYGDKPLEAGRVVALDSVTGSQVWSFCLLPACQAGDGIWSTPAIDGSGHGFVGVGNPDDAVLAFDVATGKRLWMTRFHTDSGRDVDVGATPIVFSSGGREMVAEGSDAGVFKVLDAGSGSVIWSRDLVNGSAVHGLLASPGYDGADFYVASAGVPVGMYALSGTDGRTLWSYNSGLPVYSAPALGNGVVVFGTGDVFGDPKTGGVVALSSATGKVLWIADLHTAVFSAPAITGGTVLIGNSRGDVSAFRAATGGHTT